MWWEVNRSASSSRRTQLGRELVFVVLSMEEEEVRARLLGRHRGHQQFAEVLMVVAIQSDNLHFIKLFFL